MGLATLLFAGCGRGDKTESPNSMPPSAASAEKSRFEDKESIRELKEAGITVEVAEEYDKRFQDAWIISRLHELKYDPSLANSFHQKFSEGEVCYMAGRGIKPEQANPYDARFREDMDWLINNSIPPEKANSFDSRFNGDDVLSFLKNHAEPNYVNSFHHGFSVRDILQFKGNGISPEKVSACLIELEGNYITKKISGGKVGNLTDTIIEILRAGGDTKFVLKYDSSFFEDYPNGGDRDRSMCKGVIAMKNYSIAPEEANRFAELNVKYGARISGFDVVRFKINEVPFETVEEHARQLWIDGLVQGHARLNDRFDSY
ncbi:hypothetical protein HYU13_05150 [Candidatus Woesearchaeota archaeon]|nr:hypothetical protein [Candidatus Woesearchaeota archaeon]